MLETGWTRLVRVAAGAAVALVVVLVHPGGAGAAPSSAAAVPPSTTTTDTIAVDVTCSASVPVDFDAWLQHLQVTVTHPTEVPFGSFADLAVSASFVTDSGIPEGGGHWGEVSFVTAATDPAGFAPTFGDPHVEVTGPAASHAVGPVAFDDVDVPGLPGQSLTTTLTAVEVKLHIPWRGSSMFISGHCVPVAPVTLLDIPVVDPGPGQTVGDQVVVTVHAADGSLLYGFAGFTDGNAFTFSRGAQNGVHAVAGLGSVPGPAGGRTQVLLSGTAQQGPGGAPELPFGPAFVLLVADPAADIAVESGLVPGAPAGIVQVSATGPQVRSVAGVAVGTVRQWVGPASQVKVPVVIRWQVRDLV